MLKNFRTYNLAVKFYHSSRSLKISSSLKEQLSRAASSVVLNLAEGSGRATKADQCRFYNIAFGSLRECQAILELTDNLNHGSKEIAEQLAAHLYCLINK